MLTHTAHSTRTTRPVVLRPATAADARALRVLAALDSAEVPAGTLDVAEVDGQLHAAVAREDGSAIADPFHPSATLVALLRAHRSLGRRR